MQDVKKKKKTRASAAVKGRRGVCSQEEPNLTEVISRFEAIQDLLQKSTPKPEVATKVFGLVEAFCVQANTIMAALQKQLKGGILKKNIKGTFFLFFGLVSSD